MTDWERTLERWRDAGLIDQAAAERIRAFEAAQPIAIGQPQINGDAASAPTVITGQPAEHAAQEPADHDVIAMAERARAREQRGLRWPAIVALVFGGLMLGAGVLLFVAAHWDNLSPSQRFALVVGMVAVFHGAGLVASMRASEYLAIVMHGLGTASLGAGIFLAAQIFNLQSHWPSGIMLWAAGAWIGYALRRDWVQFAMAAVLTPAWLAGEWVETFTNNDFNASVHAFRVLDEGALFLAICYLASRSRDVDTAARRVPDSAVLVNNAVRVDSAARRVLVWIGAIVILPLAVALAAESEMGMGHATGVAPREIIGYMIAFGLPVALAAWLRGRDMWMNLIAGAWVFLLGLIAAKHNVGVYAWCGLGAAGLIAWGVRDGRSERINLGMIGFAITLLVFYFSEVMDKLERSASLVGLGILFLMGGWGLEKMRRRFVAQARGPV